jgi:hypothetical protein
MPTTPARSFVKRSRLLALGLLSSLAFATPGHAVAPKPQISDATGDTVVPAAGTDIVSVLFSTAGTTTKVKKKTVYTPTKLVVTVTYAGPVDVDPQATHTVTFNSGCGAVYLEFFAGETTYGEADCAADSFDFGTKVDGKTLTFTLPFGTLGKSIKPGSKLSELRAYTAFGDPVIGTEGVYMTGLEQTANDVATTGATYTVA